MGGASRAPEASETDDSEETRPVVELFRIAPGALEPMRADRGALGTLPTAAYQYCEPVCLASAFGWYVFAPIDFHAMFDGTELLWTDDGGSEWSPLETEHLPGLPDVFDAIAPEDVRGFAPPFLTATSQPGVLQIWTGFMIRTRPGWSVLVRPPANLARSQHYEPYEGILETDRFFSPLFTNVRITTTDRPIAFSRGRPLVQVQPLERSTYEERSLKSFAVRELSELGPSEWDGYRKTVVARRRDEALRPGRYAAAARRRARTE